MRAPSRRTLGALVAAALALAPMPGTAAPARPEIALAAPEIEGEIPEFWHGEITGRIRDALAEDADVTVLVGSACTASGCDEAALGDATHLVRVRLSEEARRYTLEIAVEELGSGERLESREECPLCGLAEVAEMAASQARALRRKLGSRADAVGVVTVETRPPGADITVDGVPRGRTPAQLELSPGVHEITLHRAGYQDTQRRVEAVADVRETWSVGLVAREDRRSRARAMKIAGGVMLGLMVPALVAGSTFLALDGKPYRAKCSGDDVDADGDCRLRYASNVPGGVLVGLAAALALGGIVLLNQARTRSARGADRRAGLIHAPRVLR